MAERRMFAKSIIGSARFLRMPSTSRLLYYDLGMQADDDGIVEAFSVMRTTGATEDDLKVLASKGFVSVLNDDLVAHITDWSRNNLIKKDRYHPSIYHELLVKIGLGTQMEPGWNPSGTQMEPEDRLGKDSLGESECKADKPPRTRFVPPTVEQVAEYVKQRGSRVDPQGFIDFYAAKGWLIGKAPMKDWKAACRNAEHWERWKQNTAPAEREPIRRGKYKTIIENGEEVDVPDDE